MTKKFLVIALIYLGVLTLALSSFAAPFQPRQPGPPDRRPLFVEGYRQLPFAVSFAAKSREFISGLTETEKQLFSQIGRLTEAIKQYREWEEPRDRERDLEGSKLPMLQFSENPEDFKLNPGEKPRLAKTTAVFIDPILVNLLYLNSPNINPKYIEVLQIIFHELGHKISRADDQKVIDSLAAKLIQFLMPYYHIAEAMDENPLYGKVRVELLSLPVNFRFLRFDAADSARILISAGGLVDYHLLDVFRIQGILNRFTDSFDRSGYGRIQEDLSLRITKLQIDNLLGFHVDFKLSFESGSRLIVEGLDNFPSGSSSSLPGSNMQYMEMKPRSADIIAPEISSFDTTWSMSKPESGWGRGNPQHLVPRSLSWEYEDRSIENRVLSVTQTPAEIRMAIKESEKFLSVQLRLQDEDTTLLLEGRRVSKLGQKGQWHFSIPQSLSSKTGQVKIRDIVVNGRSRSLLPEVVHLQTRKNTFEESFSLSQMTFFDGTNWVVYKDVLNVPPGPVKMRLTVRGNADIDKIYLRWNSGSSVLLGDDDFSLGTLSEVQEEIIKDFKLVDTFRDTKTYEFFSKEVLKIVLPEFIIEGPRAEDSGRRFLKHVRAVNLKMQSASHVFADHRRIFNKEYIGVKTRAGIFRCEGVFR